VELLKAFPAQDNVLYYQSFKPSLPSNGLPSVSFGVSFSLFIVSYLYAASPTINITSPSFDLRNTIYSSIPKPHPNLRPLPKTATRGELAFVVQQYVLPCLHGWQYLLRIADRYLLSNPPSFKEIITKNNNRIYSKYFEQR
jgi:hypothetical protein